jgi:hypothetical protein
MARERWGMPARSRTPKATAELARRRRQIIDAIAALGPTLPGSLVQRTSRCGNAGCHCRADPPRLHGPYWVWTRSINGKTVTRSVSDEQAERYRPWFDNTQRLRELTEQLKQLALEQAQTDQNWPTS